MPRDKQHAALTGLSPERVHATGEALDDAGQVADQCQDEQDSETNMTNLRLRSPVNGRRGMKIEIVLTTTEAGLVVEKVVAQDNVTDRTNIKNFLTWYSARLLKGGFNLYRDDHNIFGWVAVDARGDMLTIR